MSFNTDKFAKTAITYTTNTDFLRQVQSGNEKAWHEFYNRYAGMICHIGRKHQLSPEECDDLMIEVMVIFWKKLEDFLGTAERGRFRDYLAKITHSSVSKILKKSPSKPTGSNSEKLEYPEDVDEVYMAEWRDFILARALEELQQQISTETYQVFYMSVIQKRPVSEIAAITRKTSNNIYVIRSRCLKTLRELIAFFRQCEESELVRHSQRNELLD